MTTRPFAAAAALALAALPRPARAQSDAEAVREALKGAASVEVKEQDLPAEAKQKLAAALGAGFAPAADGKLALGVAKDLPNPLEDPEKLASCCAAAASAGKARVVVIAFPDADAGGRLTVADVRLLAPASPSEDLKQFAASLRWRYPGPNAYESPEAFEALRKAADAGADETAKQNRLLLTVARDMQAMDGDVRMLKWKAAANDAAGAKAAAAGLLKKYQATHALYPQAGFVFKGSAEEQQKQLPILAAQNEKGLDEAASLKAAADAGDLAKAQRKAGTLSCAKCHGIFMKPFQQLRADRKIGNGYFVPGHDLIPVEGADADAAKEIAAAARKALLLIDQAAK